MSFSYTKLSSYILDQLWGFSSVNALNQSLRFLGEDVLGDPSVTGWRRNYVTKTDGTNPGVGGVTISGSSGNFSTGTGAFVDITNLSIQLSTSGRPVLVFLVNDASGNQAEIGGASSTNGMQGIFKFLRDATEISRTEISITTTFTGAIGARTTGTLLAIDTPVVGGPYTYKLQAIGAGGGLTAECKFQKLVAFEI